MDIRWAAEQLRQGKKVARTYWAEEIWLILDEAGTVCRKTASGLSPWRSYIDDFTAEDWRLAGSHDFAWALKKLNAGKLVRRAGWADATDKYIYKNSGDIRGSNKMLVAFWIAWSNEHSLWDCTQDDLLIEDWELVEDEQ